MMKRTTGFLHWVFPAMLVVVALTPLLSGRDLSQSFSNLAGPAILQHPAVPWAQRVVSLILLAVSAERIYNHFASDRRMPSPLLTAAFVTYWLCSVAAPAFLGTNPRIAHEYLYPVIFGGAALLSPLRSAKRSWAPRATPCSCSCWPASCSFR